MLKIGSHVGMAGKEMLLGAAKEAASYGANTFMIYTGAPQNTRRKPIEELNIEAGWQYMNEHGLSDIYTSSNEAEARSSGSGKRANISGVCMFTRLSVHWADRITAIRR